MTARPRTDLELSRRLERTEARGNAAFVEARARLAPASGATWRDVQGTWTMFDGVGSPITQTFGLGLFAPAEPSTLDEIEAFFQQRGADVNHEVSPMADPALLSRLPERGYRPCELSTVLQQRLDVSGIVASESGFLVRPLAPDEEQLWADTQGLGWSDTPELAAFARGFGVVSAHSAGCVCFIVEEGREAVAAGAIVIHEGVALLAGASTRPEWRRRGAQSTLLAARLAHARAQGCDLAMMVAAPGSTSQQNAERHGFQIAYTRMKWWRAHRP